MSEIWNTLTKRVREKDNQLRWKGQQVPKLIILVSQEAWGEHTSVRVGREPDTDDGVTVYDITPLGPM